MLVKFPIILFLDKKFYVGPKELLNALGVSTNKNESMIFTKEHLKVSVPGWLLDYDGNYYEFHPSGKRNEWLRPISFLWRFVISEYSLSRPRKITVSQMNEIMTNIAHEKGDRLIKKFRTFLKSCDQSEYLSKEVLDRWPI